MSTRGVKGHNAGFGVSLLSSTYAMRKAALLYNPESGASGSITAGKALQHAGMACRELRYEATVPGPAPYRKAVLTWCKTKDGWKVL